MAKVVLQLAGGVVHHGHSVPSQQFHVRDMVDSHALIGVSRMSKK